MNRIALFFMVTLCSKFRKVSEVSLAWRCLWGAVLSYLWATAAICRWRHAVVLCSFFLCFVFVSPCLGNFPSEPWQQKWPRLFIYWLGVLGIKGITFRLLYLSLKRPPPSFHGMFVLNYQTDTCPTPSKLFFSTVCEMIIKIFSFQSILSILLTNINWAQICLFSPACLHFFFFLIEALLF